MKVQTLFENEEKDDPSFRHRFRKKFGTKAELRIKSMDKHEVADISKLIRDEFGLGTAVAVTAALLSVQDELNSK